MQAFTLADCVERDEDDSDHQWHSDAGEFDRDNGYSTDVDDLDSWGEEEGGEDGDDGGDDDDDGVWTVMVAGIAVINMVFCTLTCAYGHATCSCAVDINSSVQHSTAQYSAGQCKRSKCCQHVPCTR